MTLEKYFEKTGKIYGVSSKFDFGEWHHRLAEFDSRGRLPHKRDWVEGSHC